MSKKVRSPAASSPAARDAPPTTANFLIGFGERLTKKVDRAGRNISDKALPYTFEETITRLKPGLASTAAALSALPQTACPAGEVVALVTLHPEFLAKSYYPGGAMAEAGLRPIGSRSREIRPQQWTARAKPRDRGRAPTIEMYVAGQRDRVLRWAHEVPHWNEYHRGASDLIRIEEVRPLTALSHRLVTPPAAGKELFLEVALHSNIGLDIVDDFSAFIATLGGTVLDDLTINVRGLAFVPVRVPRARYQELAQYGFLRVARPLTKLRNLHGLSLRGAPALGPYLPPSLGPVNPAERIAILDGGLPEDHGLPATQVHELDVADADSRYCEHGLMVTGAYLHGPINPGDAAVRPYTAVDHYRILDENDDHNDAQLFKVLRRIQNIVGSSGHDLFNLSLGPDVAIEDDEVHVWTSTLDQLAASGRSLLMVAAGNNGGRIAPLHRIQVPGDGVNVCCVGAADRRGMGWKRADYSAIGPGRRPGVIKPDIVAFGGSSADQFCLLRSHGTGYVLTPGEGTSFATPLAMRAAACVRAHYGSQLRPLTLRALLVHTAEQDVVHAAGTVGWGRIGSEPDLLVCPPATARIIYQGELTPKQSLRAPIPLPDGLNGNVTITATICFASAVSAADPMNYTNNGLEITFRPDVTALKPNAKTKRLPKHAKSAPFFGDSYSEYASEEERRAMQYKWETVVHGRRVKQVRSLINPVFDVHVVPRDGVQNTSDVEPIPYAMVISIHAPKHADIYNRVLQAYSGKLQTLAPVQIPLRT